VPTAAGCARCDEPATTVVAEISGLTLYIDLCQEHLDELLEGARSVASERPGALIEPRGRR
jgi:hypothetical protein